MFDLETYLRRIGLDGAASLADVHRAHVTTFPFENLDPQRGVPISLDQDAIVAKLISAKRGGYCFEQNLLLRDAFEALGARVELLLARVRDGSPRTRPLNHILLRAEDDRGLWHADAGFGAATTLLEPIPFGPGGPYEQSGWCFRVVADGRELVLQARGESGWEDQYGFVPEAAPMIDLVTNNWFTCTYPHSPFVTGLVVARCRANGTWLELRDWSGELTLTEHTPGGSTGRPVARDEICRLLADSFGLPGFELDADGRVVTVDQAFTPDSA